MGKPNLIGKESEGIHKLAYESIMKCDVDPTGSVHQHGAVWRYHHVPEHRCPSDQRDDGIGTRLDQGEDRGTAGEEVLSVDWRFDPFLAVHVPGDVDLEG